MDALKKAIEVDRRREKRKAKAKIVVPDKIYEAKKDLLPKKIVEIREKLSKLFKLNKQEKIAFSNLLNEHSPKERLKNFYQYCI